MREQLSKCQAAFGSVPRKFSLWSRLGYLQVKKPAWLVEDPSEEMELIFDNYQTVFRNGRVVWGQIIQANRLLFEEGDDDCPGELVYSLDDPMKVDVDYLQRVAGELFSLKGTAPADSQLKSIADYLTDEYTRVFGLPVPKVLSPNVKCQISTTYFVRKHLPNGRLCATLLPVVVNQKPPFVALPLPARFWPDDLIAWWSRGGRASQSEQSNYSTARNSKNSQSDYLPLNFCETHEPINYRKWLVHLLTWDGFFPIAMITIPILVSRFFPQKNDIGLVLAVTVAQAVAVLFRFRIGMRHIKENFCGTTVKLMQKAVFCVAMFFLVTFEVVQAVAPPAKLADLASVAFYGAIYFAVMASVLYPGRRPLRDEGS